MAHSTPTLQQTYPIDMNRGVMQMRRMTPRLKLANGEVAYKGKSGQVQTEPDLAMDVFMYLDEPGIYYDAKGRRVGEALAASQGYNTKRLAKLKAKEDARKDLASSMAEIVAERMYEVIDQADGFRLVQLGDTQFQVEDADGNHLMPEPLNIEAAREFFELVQEGAEAPVEAPMIFPSKSSSSEAPEDA